MKKIDPFQILKQEHSLSTKDIEFIKSNFIKNKIFDNELFMGQFFDEKPNIIIGAPCIRKDIEGISLNTFYQLFLPLKIAGFLKIPCKIFLGVREEIILQPDLDILYERLGERIKQAVKKISRDLSVNAETINTGSPHHDLLIKKTIRNLNIKLFTEESTYLYNLSLKKHKKPPSSSKRISCNKRVVACNTYHLLKTLFGEKNFLIVEDIEQYKCSLFANKFDNGKSPNFLAFLPLPSIYGTQSMFKAIKEKRFILEQDNDYYKEIFKKTPPMIKAVYKKFFDLFQNKKTSQKDKLKNFIYATKKISNYF